MRYGSTQEKIYYWLFQNRIPVTKLLILTNIATFLAITLFQVFLLLELFAFGTTRALTFPWTFFTYPLICGCCLLNSLFAWYWLWVAGGAVERAWGSRRFAVYFFLMSAVSALGLFAGSLAGGVVSGAAGLWLPLAGVTIAFAMIDPEQEILFFAIIPMKLKYLALLDVAFVLVEYGKHSLILGVFALAGCAASYWYVTAGKRTGSLGERYREPGEVIRVRPRHGSTCNLNPFKWYKDYRQRKRLKDLFDRSGFKD